jgi:2-polyprenyl-6-methoxyphenol hydroxylase-like FAD-dependent oxidoreductase
VPGPTYDTVVVGGRIAGAATALLLARAGRRVLVLERGRYGSDTLSTHALMRGGVLQLSRWGLMDQLRAAGTPPVRRTVVRYAAAAALVAAPLPHGTGLLIATLAGLLPALLRPRSTS